jgi:hypothetical protein
VRPRAECRHLVGNPSKQFHRHGTRLGAYQICAEIRLVITCAHVAHEATQIAEIIDPEYDMGRPEIKMSGQKPLVYRAKKMQHGLAVSNGKSAGGYLMHNIVGKCDGIHKSVRPFAD